VREGWRSGGGQKCESAKVQEYKSARVEEFKSVEVEEWRSAKVQEEKRENGKKRPDCHPELKHRTNTILS